MITMSPARGLLHEHVGAFQESPGDQKAILWPSRAFASLQQPQQLGAPCPAHAALATCSRSSLSPLPMPLEALELPEVDSMPSQAPSAAAFASTVYASRCLTQGLGTWLEGMLLTVPGTHASLLSQP